MIRDASDDAPGPEGESESGVDAAGRIPSPQPTPNKLFRAVSGWLAAIDAWVEEYGGKGLRGAIGVGWFALILVGGLVLLVGPILGKPPAPAEREETTKPVIDTWIARHFAADYRLVLGPDGHLSAEVEERITAFFPKDVDESSIERVLLTQVGEDEPHPVRVEDLSVTLNGATVQPEQSAKPGWLILTVETGERLQGDHELVINYTLHDLATGVIDDTLEQPADQLVWDAFGPDLNHGVAGLEVTVTLPQALDARLVRGPRADVGWNILSSSAWLDAEPGSGAEVSYQFTNEQNLPPHSYAQFAMSFEAGSIVMPTTVRPPAPLWPLFVPLALLLLLLVPVFAARAVAWADHPGQPWIAPRGTVPGPAAEQGTKKGRAETELGVLKAAHLLGARATMGVASALHSAQGGERAEASRVARFRAVAGLARRAGRVRDWPRMLAQYNTPAARQIQIAAGLRHSPGGFTRGTFSWIALALLVLQWGLLRQITAGMDLAAVWWPVPLSLLVTALVIAVWCLVGGVLPLTKRGAILKQKLQGIGLHAERTGMLERGPLSDPLLPYAVLAAPARTVRAHLGPLIAHQFGEDTTPRDRRPGGVLSWPALVVGVLASLLVAGAILTPIVLPVPYQRVETISAYGWDLPGVSLTEVQTVDIVGTLGRSPEGQARVEVVETFTMEFDDTSWRVPQFARQWPATVNGVYELGLRVGSVTLDGEAVPYVVEPEHDTLILRSTLPKPIGGSHEVRISYTLDSAAVATEFDGAQVESVHWVALLKGWEYESTWGRSIVDGGFRLEFRIDDELAELVRDEGWITEVRRYLPEGDRREDALVPYEDEAAAVAGTQSHTIDLTREEGGYWPREFTVKDVGAQALFSPGTFVGSNLEPIEADPWAPVREVMPVLLVFAVILSALLAGLTGTVLGLLRRPRIFERGFARTVAWWWAPVATFSGCILFVWVSLEMASGDWRLALVGWPLLAAIAACISGMVLSRRSRRRTKQPS